MAKKYQIMLIVIGALLIVTVGVSFSYYITTINVVGEGAKQQATTAEFMSVVYDAGTSKLEGTELVPGSSLTKDFSVKLTPTTEQKEATYAIKFQIDSNTFKVCDDTTYVEVSNECMKNAQELIIVLKDKDTGEIISTTDVTGSSGEIKLATITKTVETETTFNYTLELQFKNTNEPQNHNQNASIIGSIKVEFSNKPVGKELILSKNTIDTSRSSGYFPEAFEEDTAGKIFSTQDDDGTTYFFAGSNPNNWVSFAGFYWRIIRINGDGSIRLIYNGSTTDQTGSGTQIGPWQSAFNDNSDDNAYVGYMYGTVGSSSYVETHANINSSSIKTVLDNWYNTNLKSYYEQFIDMNAGFCGDRAIDNYEDEYTGDGSGKTKVEYAPYNRSYNTHIATYKCSNSNDYYTVSSANKGNKALTNPIGTITSDEVMYAGGYNGDGTQNHWLNTGEWDWYFTMSPSSFDGYTTRVHCVTNGSVGPVNVDGLSGVRPVISLKSDTITLGSGTTSDPFRIA